MITPPLCSKLSPGLEKNAFGTGDITENAPACRKGKQPLCRLRTSVFARAEMPPRGGREETGGELITRKAGD